MNRKFLVRTVLAVAAGAAMSACVTTPESRPTAAPAAPPPPVQLTRVYFYPLQGQSEAQQDRDRYECFSWAVRQTGFRPQSARGSRRAAHCRGPRPFPRPGHRRGGCSRRGDWRHRGASRQYRRRRGGGCHGRHGAGVGRRRRRAGRCAARLQLSGWSAAIVVLNSRRANSAAPCPRASRAAAIR